MRELVSTPADFQVGIPGFTFEDLYRPEGLSRLTQRFYETLQQEDAVLAGAFATYRAAGGKGLAGPAEADLLIRVSQVLSRFVAKIISRR